MSARAVGGAKSVPYEFLLEETEEGFAEIKPHPFPKLPNALPAAPQAKPWNKAASGGLGRYAIHWLDATQIHDRTKKRVVQVAGQSLRVNGIRITLGQQLRSLSPLLVQDGDKPGVFVITGRGNLKKWPIDPSKSRESGLILP